MDNAYQPASRRRMGGDVFDGGAQRPPLRGRGALFA